MAETWKIGETEDSHLKLMGAASKILDNGEPGPCPLCNGDSVRFYCHRFDKEAMRGTIWVWCPTCRNWGHISRVRFERTFSDPFEKLSLKEFEAMEMANWLDRLNQIWDDGAIPSKLGEKKLGGARTR